jgi:hypothetical protein
VRRALLLLGPAELQELQELRTLHVDVAGTCEIIQSLLEQEAAACRLSGEGAPRDAPVSRALASVRVIKGDNLRLSPALLLRCATTLTELECHHLTNGAHSVLPRCTRLESLTFHNWSRCPFTAWLGLSQLHTLRGVSLSGVPAAAVAAALPRLHTLHLQHDGNAVDFAVAAFYDELLPRLRSFHLEGAWPKANDEARLASVQPLPLLEDLTWGCDVGIPRRLMGARPSTLDIVDAALVGWLRAAHGAASPVTRVRALTLRFEDSPPDAATLARLLRAAPHLRRLTVSADNPDYVRWALEDEDDFEFTNSPEPPFAGLTHPRLRHFAISGDVPDVPDGCGVRLRERFFPRLRRLTVDEEEYPVWVPPRPAPQRRARRSYLF